MTLLPLVDQLLYSILLGLFLVVSLFLFSLVKLLLSQLLLIEYLSFAFIVPELYVSQCLDLSNFMITLNLHPFSFQRLLVHILGVFLRDTLHLGDSSIEFRFGLRFDDSELIDWPLIAPCFEAGSGTLTFIVVLELGQPELLVVMLSDSGSFVLLNFAGLQVTEHLFILGHDSYLALGHFVRCRLADLVHRGASRLEFSEILTFKISVH